MPTNIEIPALGESVTEAILLKWHKADGEYVKADEPICELETDKANVDVPAPAAGVIKRSSKEGDTVKVGQSIGTIDESAKASAAKPAGTAAPAAAAKSPPKTEAKAAAPQARPEDLAPSVRRIVAENKLDTASIAGTGRGGRITKEDATLAAGGAVAAPAPAASPAVPEDAPPPPVAEAPATPPRPVPAGPAIPPLGGAPKSYDAQGVHRAPMSKIRKRIAERLLQAQQTAAILTTFNEIDLHNVMAIRGKYKEKFNEIHGISLGLMSFFVRATVLALREFPKVNAFIEGDEVVYHNYVHMGIAVSTDRGLAVPVLRHTEHMSFAKIESEIKRLANATREGKLSLDELTGGTFTITNGGVFGSLLSTPILNPPQSGILGMHTIQKRPMVVGDKIEIRPMMYVALSYDHRLIDGKDSVSFLVRLKELLEDPARLMLEI